MYGHTLLRCLRLPLRNRAEFCLSPSYFTPSVASRTKPSGIFLRIWDCRGYGSWNHTLSCDRQSLLAPMGGTTGRRYSNERATNEPSTCMSSQPEDTQYFSITQNRAAISFYATLKEKENYKSYFEVMDMRETENDLSRLVSESPVMYAVDKLMKTYITSCRNPSSNTGSGCLQILKHRYRKLYPHMTVDESLCLLKVLFHLSQKLKNAEIDKGIEWITYVSYHSLLDRVQGSSKMEVFRVMSVLFLTGYIRLPKILSALMNKLVDRHSILEVPEQLVLFFFYLNLKRINKMEYKFDIDEHILNLTASHLPNMNILETSIIALGLVRVDKWMTGESEKLDSAIVRTLEDNLAASDFFLLTSLVKYITYSSTRSVNKRGTSVFSALTNKQFTSKVAAAVAKVRLDDISFLIYTLKLYNTLFYCPDCLFEAITSKVLELGPAQMANTFVSEILFWLIHFDYKGEKVKELYRLLTLEMEKWVDTEQFEGLAYSLSMGLTGLCMLDVYPIKLYEFFLENGRLAPLLDICEADYVLGIPKAKMYSLSHFLNESVRIDRPDYDGPFLPKELWRGKKIGILPKQKWESKKQRSCFMSDIEKELKGYLGDKRLFKSHTFLKHFTVKDIAIVVNESGEAVPVSEWKWEDGQIKPHRAAKRTPVISLWTKILIIPLDDAHNYFTFEDREGNLSRHLDVSIRTKYRQLRRLGYEIVAISRQEFSSCKSKQECLHQKLSPYLRKPAETTASHA